MAQCTFQKSTPINKARPWYMRFCAHQKPGTLAASGDFIGRTRPEPLMKIFPSKREGCNNPKSPKAIGNKSLIFAKVRRQRE